MKKVLYIVSIILQVALLIGAYIFQYFTTHKMGMARHMVYLNQGWQRDYPVEQLKVGILAVFAIFFVALMIFNVKKAKQGSKFTLVMIVWTIISAILYIGFTLIFTADELRAYYVLSLIFALVAWIQLITISIGIRKSV